MAVVTRFAPSPTGLLHLGHVHAAAFAWRAARQAAGAFLLRLEDIDPTRCHQAFAEAIVADLHWLGLDHDREIRVQSAHLPAYREALSSLAARGLIYPCFCSRAAIAREIARSAAAPHGPDGAAIYPGTCRTLPSATRAARLDEGAPHAWRLDMRRALAASPARRFLEQGDLPGAGWITADPAPFGDVILARRDAPASYHLCVTHDDAVQGVTLVPRAEDLRPATHLHVLLQQLMGWPTPAYAHHRLLHGPDGARLAKRDGAATVRALRDAGQQPQDVLALAGAPDLNTYR
jgi:glutamyl-Q tRNA(Asp) synthetase